MVAIVPAPTPPHQAAAITNGTKATPGAIGPKIQDNANRRAAPQTAAANPSPRLCNRLRKVEFIAIADLSTITCVRAIANPKWLWAGNIFPEMLGQIG